MRCSNCNANRIYVKSVKNKPDKIIRYRVCKKCGFHFTTEEYKREDIKQLNEMKKSLEEINKISGYFNK